MSSRMRTVATAVKEIAAELTPEAHGRGMILRASRILLVREVKERGRFRRWFEEARLEDLVLVRQASTPELLRDFGRWQDVRWRRETLALR